MVPPDQSLDVTSSVESRWPSKEIEVISQHTNPATDVTIIDLQIALQMAPPTPPLLPQPEAPKVSTEVGKVDFFV
jgi:hypothetical protein